MEKTKKKEQGMDTVVACTAIGLVWTFSVLFCGVARWSRRESRALASPVGDVKESSTLIFR